MESKPEKVIRTCRSTERIGTNQNGSTGSCQLQKINHKSATLTTECLLARGILSTKALFFCTPLNTEKTSAGSGSSASTGGSLGRHGHDLDLQDHIILMI